MKLTKMFTGVLGLAALAMSSVNAATLADPGFEGTLVEDGFGVGKWAPFNFGPPNLTSVSTVNPRSGSQSLRLELVDANAFAGVFQDVPVTAGGEITFSGWNAIAVGASGGSEVRIEFRDSVGNMEVSRTSNLVPALTGAYTEFSLTDTVPAGADTARVVYAIQSFGAAPPQTVDVDDLAVSGTAIPEPSGSILMLLGFAGLAVRRRR